MNRRLLFTLGVLVAAIVLHWKLNTPASIPEPWGTPRWRWEIGPVITGLSMVLPGALVGFVAGRHGLLLGALVGYLGHLLGSLHMLIGEAVSPDAIAVLRSEILMPLGHAIVSAAGGATGQLLRSNKSLKRTHGE